MQISCVYSLYIYKDQKKSSVLFFDDAFCEFIQILLVLFFFFSRLLSSTRVGYLSQGIKREIRTSFVLALPICYNYVHFYVIL